MIQSYNLLQKFWYTNTILQNKSNEKNQKPGHQSKSLSIESIIEALKFPNKFENKYLLDPEKSLEFEIAIVKYFGMIFYIIILILIILIVIKNRSGVADI